MKKKMTAWTAYILLLLLSGCTFAEPHQGNAPSTTQAPEQSAYTAPSIGDYDSVDTAIVVKKDTENRTISLRNLETGKQYTLAYDGTSILTDQNEQVLSMEQIHLGDLVDVTFLKTGKTLTSLQESPTAFRYQNQTDFEVSESGRAIKINGTAYKLASDLVVVADGTIGTLMDINECDTLAIKGYDNVVHSIVIEKGHGYLRLKNDEAFIGGWIEVGSYKIVPITENMLLTVPEGNYDVSVSCGGSGGTKNVTIYRDAEQTMDVGDLVSEVKEGKVFFDITPATASVYIDGEKIDTSEAVTLTYGIHQLIIRAEGYETLSKYVRVGQEMATLVMELEKQSGTNNSDSDSDETDSSDTDHTAQEGAAETENTASGGENSTNTDEVISAGSSSSYQVRIEAPEGAEVYVDGTYIGLAPISFPKVTGSHVLTLRQSGYQTRSYTIEVDDQEKDISYSFSQMVPIE